MQDDEGRILLTPWDLDHAEYVRHAFNQLRVYAAPHPQVATAIVRALRMLRSAAESAGQASAAAALTLELDHTLEAVRAANPLPSDLEAVLVAASGPVKIP